MMNFKIKMKYKIMLTCKFTSKYQTFPEIYFQCEFLNIICYESGDSVVFYIRRKRQCKNS